MVDNKIVFKNKEADCQTSVLGISGENEQQRLIFCFEDKFIEGTAYLELELPDGKKGSLQLEKEGETYWIIVKNSLLTQVGNVEMQLKIIQKTAIWKSITFDMNIVRAVNAVETIEEDYSNWVDRMTIRMQELDEAVKQISDDVANLEKYDDTEIREEIEQVKKETEGSIKEETDPTVPAHVKSITEENIESWNNKSDFSGNYEDLENKPVIPSLEGVASEEFVRQELGKLEVPEVDLTGLATESYVDEKIGDIDTLLDSIAEESEAI